MNNIEKFQKVKELSRLKAEWHKREMQSYFTLAKYENLLSPKWRTVLEYSDVGILLIKAIKPFISNRS